MKTSTILIGAAVLAAAYVVYKRSAGGPVGVLTAAGEPGGGSSPGALLDTVIGGGRAVWAGGSGLAETLGWRTHEEKPAGTGYSLYADPRGTRAAGKVSAVSYGNDSTYSETLILGARR